MSAFTVMSANPAVRWLVVIGGSQGSLEALEELLPHLPALFSPAVAVVLHPYRHGSGGLARVLASKSRLPVVTVDDKEPLQPGHLFVAPANYHLLVEVDRTFALNTDAPVNLARPSIDVLFESAAHAFGSNAVGVLLCGGGADGAAGLRRIKANGGQVACQKPEGAAEPSMPRAGQQATPLDYLGTPKELGTWLSQLCP